MSNAVDYRCKVCGGSIPMYGPSHVCGPSAPRNSLDRIADLESRVARLESHMAKGIIVTYKEAGLEE